MKLKSKYRDIIMKRARRLTFTSMQQNKHPDTHSPLHNNIQVLHSHVVVFMN